MQKMTCCSKRFPVKHKQPLNSACQFLTQNCIQLYGVNSSLGVRTLYYEASRFQMASM